MKPFVGEKVNSRVATSAEAGPSNPTRAQHGRKTIQNRVHEISDDQDDDDDVQEVEVAMTRNGKRKESHIVEDEEDEEIQEVDPPPKTTRSRGGSRKPSSTVNGKPTTTNGATTATAKGKAKVKPKIGPPRSAAKLAREPMDMHSNDVVEHEMDVDVNNTAAVANAINAALKNNAARQSGQQNDDGTTARLEERLHQVCNTQF